MILKALEAKAKGEAARFGPAEFPDIDFGEPLQVTPPWQGGDGTAVNDPRAGASKMRAETGTMTSREEALKRKKDAALTTV